MTVALWVVAVAAGCAWRVYRFATFPPSENYETRWDFQIAFFLIGEFVWLSAPFVLLLCLEVLFLWHGEGTPEKPVGAEQPRL